MAEAVKFGNCAGALACTKFGSIESMPSKAAIIQLRMIMRGAEAMGKAT